MGQSSDMFLITWGVNYLAMSSDFKDFGALKIEADFYGLEPLTEAINAARPSSSRLSENPEPSPYDVRSLNVR
jgi:hypothetical protein